MNEFTNPTKVFLYDVTQQREIEAEVFLDFDRDKMQIIAKDILNEVLVDDDFFSCLQTLRKKLEEKGLKILCNGARKNVYPSRMSRSMSQGVKAYEMELGKHGSRTDLVNIFDPAPLDQIVSVEEQEAFYKSWRESLR